MINFIICDDNKFILKEVEELIDKVMMKNKLCYKKHVFSDYNENFFKIMKTKISCKIYILDIETPTYSGIDIARMIRKNDYSSIIIFLTSYNDLGYTILKGEFLFLAFINKFDNYKFKLKSSLEKSLKILGKRQVIRFEDCGVIYTIPLNDILYITRDTVERKLIIKTDHVDYIVSKTLIAMLEILGKNFKQTHRSCIVNKNRVLQFSFSKKMILFDNGIEIDLISFKYKDKVFK